MALKLEWMRERGIKAPPTAKDQAEMFKLKMGVMQSQIAAHNAHVEEMKRRGMIIVHEIPVRQEAANG